MGKREGYSGREKRNSGRVRDHIMTVGRNTPQQVYRARSRRKIVKCPGVSRMTKETEVFNASGFLYQLRS